MEPQVLSRQRAKDKEARGGRGARRRRDGGSIADTRNDLVHSSALSDSQVDGRLSLPAEVPAKQRAVGKDSGMIMRLGVDEGPVGEKFLEHDAVHSGQRKHKGEESEIRICRGTPLEHADNDRAAGVNVSKWNFVPEWARPSTEELEVIIEAQVV